jgi:hypothetical protein
MTTLLIVKQDLHWSSSMETFEGLLGITYPELNDQYAVLCASIDIDTIILIPLGLKLSRESV